MKTLTDLLFELSKLTKVEGLKLKSLAHGEVYIESYTKENIICKNMAGETFTYDFNGRVHPAGQTILFPEEGVWQTFLNNAYLEYNFSSLKNGDICLVKKGYRLPWVLAVYAYRLDGISYAKIGREAEEVMWCISWENNKDFQGRESFPNWLVVEEEIKRDE